MHLSKPTRILLWTLVASVVVGVLLVAGITLG
jgi:hypothetical protein